ncbi:MAG: SPFH domain-containing protein [Atribacterota bacterium]|nr:SPFH domain-containing protein [Atribacterota bacterium]
MADNNEINVDEVLQRIRGRLEFKKEGKKAINQKAKDNLAIYGFFYITGLIVLFLLIAIFLTKFVSWKLGVPSFFILSGLLTLITIKRGIVDAPFPCVVFLYVFGAVYKAVGPGRNLTLWPLVRPKKLFINLAEAMLTVKDEEIELAKQPTPQSDQINSNGAVVNVKDSIMVDVTAVYRIIDPYLYVHIMPGKTVEDRTEAFQKSVLREFQAHVNEKKFTEDQVISMKGSVADIITTTSETLSRWGIELISFNLDRTEIPPGKVKARQEAYAAGQAALAKKAEAEGLAQAKKTEVNTEASLFFGKETEDLSDEERREFRAYRIKMAALEAFKKGDKIFTDGTNKDGAFSSLMKADAAVGDGDKGENNKT